MKTDTPNIRGVRVGQRRELTVLCKGGVERLIDVSDHLARYAVFAPLSDDAAFRAASMGE